MPVIDAPRQIEDSSLTVKQPVGVIGCAIEEARRCRRRHALPSYAPDSQADGLELIDDDRVLFAPFARVLENPDIVTSRCYMVAATGTVAQSPAEIGLKVQFGMTCEVVDVLRDIDGSRRGVERTPNVCGGEARVAGTRIPVWVLERARRLGAADTDLLRFYPTLGAEDLDNAWAYVGTHPEEIDRDILENEEA
jgi:uncharacterized protein (DUF433 family)